MLKLKSLARIAMQRLPVTAASRCLCSTKDSRKHQVIPHAKINVIEAWLIRCFFHHGRNMSFHSSPQTLPPQVDRDVSVTPLNERSRLREWQYALQTKTNMFDLIGAFLVAPFSSCRMHKNAGIHSMLSYQMHTNAGGITIL